MGNDQDVAVVIVPFPTQGHMLPLLYLSTRMSCRQFPVHYVSSGGEATLTCNAHLQFHGDFRELLSREQPSSAGIDLPGYRERLKKLVSENHVRKVVLIFDALMASAVESVHSLPNVKSYVFECTSTFNLYAAHLVAAGEVLDLDPAEAAEMMEQIIPESKGFRDLKNRVGNILHSGNIAIITSTSTSGEVEGSYTDLLHDMLDNLGPDAIWVWAFGLFNPVFWHKISVATRFDSMSLKWLNKQPKNSVVFVSIGRISDQEQMDKIALGLERSEQRFVWQLTGGDSKLPEGFEERVRERGIVERRYWAPQLEILKHYATGGFMSNCGWNSCMESISTGVPMAAWTMGSDEPGNAVLITKVLEIGVEVRDWRRKDKVVHWFTVEEAVRRLIMDSEERDGMRQRAGRLAALIQESGSDDGWTDGQMDFFAELKRYD